MTTLLEQIFIFVGMEVNASLLQFVRSGESQSKVRLLGGLRALINVLKQHVGNHQPTDEDLNFIEHVVNAIGSATAGHGRFGNYSEKQNSKLDSTSSS